MSVAVLITEERECAAVIPWAIVFAQARDTDLRVILPKRSSRKSGFSAFDADSAETATEIAIHASIQQWHERQAESTDGADSEEKPKESHAGLEICTQRFLASDPGTELAAQISEQSIRLLIIPAFSFTRASGEGSEWQGVLLKQAPCATICLRAHPFTENKPIRALVVAMNQGEDREPLQQAAELVEYTAGSLEALIVVPDFDEVARDVGQQMIDQIVQQALGRRAKHVNCFVRIGDSINDGLNQLTLSDFDIVLAGARREKDIGRLLNHDAKNGEENSQPTSLATVRPKQKLGGRLRQWVDAFTTRYVPQLSREQRVALVSRVQASSQWDVDFAALICLSALIAGLGLIQNSVAVVIGAMLVAPLMTPIIGAGLGLAQCNLRLIQVSFRTIYRGFATAFVIGVLLGWLACDDVSSEMTSRGAPNFLDLLVAFASGLAAAYALGRPSLSSALPGVAIAAALVPPLATSGIAAAKAAWPLAWGALLLFLTNIVAICLGTTIVFSAVGIRRMGKDDTEVPAWPRWVLLALVIVTVFLTALIHFNNYPIGRPGVPHP